MIITHDIITRCETYEERTGKPPPRVLLGIKKYDELKALIEEKRARDFTIDTAGRIKYKDIPIVISTISPSHVQAS